MDMKTVVLKTISENTSQQGKVYGMWILQYFVDGKSVSVKVVTGEKKIKDDQSIWYVSKGMAPKDFEALKPHYQEFLKFSLNPPAIPAQKSEEVPYDELDSVPF